MVREYYIRVCPLCGEQEERYGLQIDGSIYCAARPAWHPAEA